MKFIKLVSKSRATTVLFVNPETITHIEGYDEGTCVYTSDGFFTKVEDAPETVKRMAENATSDVEIMDVETLKERVRQNG